jgi:5'-nucleotidase
MTKKIFLTNDDGIYAAGLSALEISASKRSLSCFVSAPLNEQSGAGHSITLGEPLRVSKFAENRFAVHGTPTDAVYIGINALMGEKPLFAISGINKGGNLGDDITYSGTVSAAMETFYHGITSFAVSLYITDFAAFKNETFALCADFLFDEIIPEIERVIGKSELYGTPRLFNINIPETIANSGKVPIKWALFGKRLYGGDVVKRVDPRGKEYYWIGGDQLSFADIAGSDCLEIQRGSATITPVSLDFTDYEILNKIKV